MRWPRVQFHIITHSGLYIDLIRGNTPCNPFSVFWAHFEWAGVFSKVPPTKIQKVWPQSQNYEHIGIVGFGIRAGFRFGKSMDVGSRHLATRTIL